MNFKKYFFWLTALAQIIAILFNMELLDRVSKSVLMFSLLVYFWDQTEDQKDTQWVRYTTLAIVFTWIGDIMFVLYLKNFLFFFVGISAYFAAHIFFLFAFWKSTNSGKIILNFSKDLLFLVISIIVIISALAYTFFITYYTLPHLDGVIQVPISLYILSTLFLFIVSLLRKPHTNSYSFMWVFLGVILIVITNSVLVINRFLYTIPYAQYVTTTCFIVAYWFIITGLIRHFKPVENSINK